MLGGKRKTFENALPDDDIFVFLLEKYRNQNNSGGNKVCDNETAGGKCLNLKRMERERGPMLIHRLKIICLCYTPPEMLCSQIILKIDIVAHWLIVHQGSLTKSYISENSTVTARWPLASYLLNFFHWARNLA